MALTLPTATRNAAADAIVDLIDAGAGAGTIQFQTAADAEAATLTFADPAFDAAGTTGAGIAKAGTITNDTSATGGVVDRFRFYDSDSTEVLQGSLATSGGDINLNTLTINAGDVVAIATLTVTMPAT